MLHVTTISRRIRKRRKSLKLEHKALKWGGWDQGENPDPKDPEGLASNRIRFSARVRKSGSVRTALELLVKKSLGGTRLID